MEWDDDEISQPPKSFFQRYKIALGVGALGLTLAIFLIVKIASSGGGSSRRDSITIISLPPPPPPPPPPQNTPAPPPEQKMEQPMIKEEAPKEVEQPKNEPPLGTGIKGDGSSDSFGLGSSGNGRIGGGQGGNSTKWVGYASQVQSRIEEALRRNRRTRNASLDLNVRLWPDAGGHVRRAQLVRSTGDQNLDNALRDEVLSTLQLQPPPPDMPTPLTLHLVARRP